MRIKDKIYGFEIVKDKSLVSLINSSSVQRLKDISQLGIPDEYSHLRGFSRYEHSLGVMILLKNLGASLEEQVAGLLHDVSHTPFSHVVDWVIGDPAKEDYQDNIHKDFLQNSDIPLILSRYGFNLKYISDYKNFKLLERDPPSLCADRIDYSIREMGMRKGKTFVKKIINNLSVKDKQIVFLDEKIANVFAKEYILLQNESWAANETRSRYYIFSEVLKKAFKDNLINREDLKKTEGYMLEILKNSNDEFILNSLNLLKRGFNVIPDENGIELKKKFRYVDPEVCVNGMYYPLSKISEEYYHLMNLEKKKNHQLTKVKIIPN